MARGGYRDPGPGQPPSGPGRFSRRTDGNQANRTPGLSGSDLQYGDVSKLQAGQRAVPLPRGGGPGGGGPAPAPQGGGPPLSAPANASGLAPFVTEQVSGRPGEPITNGMDMGPGADSSALSTMPDDDRTAVLQYLATTYGNQDALEMLNEMRGVAAAQGATPGPAPPPNAQGPVVPSPAGPDASGQAPAGDGGSFDPFLSGDAPDTIAEPTPPEAAAPQGPSQPLPQQT